jgi:microcystin-dependent protein
MRTCFSSQFRLFPGRPEITPGTWVRVRSGTPHYPGLHWLGSRDWTSKERETWPALGELPGPVRSYRTGQAEGPQPPAVLLGSASCLANGEAWPLPLVVRDLRSGWDSRCYPFGLVPSTSPPTLIDITFALHTLALAEVLDTLYSDVQGAASQLRTFLGPGWTVTAYATTSNVIPPMLIGIRGNQTVVIIGGSQNDMQLAIQALLSTRGPDNFGVFGTSLLWFRAANLVFDRMLALGADPNGPIVVAGHSFGAAVSAIAAARMQLHNPNRSIQLLTFGMPTPGDARLIAALPRRSLHFVNIGDPVPYLPPNNELLNMLFWLLPLGTTNGWRLWRQTPDLVGLNTDRSRVDNPAATTLYPIILQIIQQWLLGGPVGPFDAHFMNEYVNRLGGSSPEVNDVIAGTVISYSGGSIPAGYLDCNGQAVSRTLFSNLFGAIGVTWGPGDGVTTFNVPDLRSRSIVGVGQGIGLSNYNLADFAGQEVVSLTVPQMPTHGHPVADPGHFHPIARDSVVGITGTFAAGDTLFGIADGATKPAFTGLSILNTGGGGSHENRHPIAALRWLIKT